MKIVIANSLLEPVGISWNEAASHVLLHWEIESAIARYVIGVEKNMKAGITDITPHDISIGLMQVVRNHGVKEVYSGRRPIDLKLADGKRMHRYYLTYRYPGEQELRKVYTSVMCP